MRARFMGKTGLAFALGWLSVGAAQGQYHFKDVPLTTAVSLLAQQGGIKYLLDPTLYRSAKGDPKPEPKLTLQWENCPPAEALARVARENHLVLTTNDYTTVVRIAGTNHFSRAVDVKLFGADTNGAVPLIYFADVPLPEAFKQLAGQAHLKIVLDPKVSGEAPPEPGSPAPMPVPTVSVRWHDLRATQAIAELCEAYGLTLVPGAAAGTLEIKPGK